MVQMYGNGAFKSHRVTLFKKIHYKYMIFVRLFGYHIKIEVEGKGLLYGLGKYRHKPT